MSERRRDLRQNLEIPVHVGGNNPDGTAWEERTTTLNVSMGGLALLLTHASQPGDTLLISLALPSRFRAYEVDAPTYQIYVVVRRVHKDPPSVDVTFFGKDPPRDRDHPRQQIPLLLLVRGSGPEGPWEERTLTLDVSAGGVCFALKRPVRLGEALHLHLPLPQRLRQHDLTSPSYSAYGVVRKVGAGDPPRVGVAFHGKTPPEFFGKTPPRLRKDDRHEANLPLQVRGHDKKGRPWEEMAITEDVSISGTSFLLRHPVSTGDALHLSLPLRASLRRYDQDVPLYEVYALVRKVGRGHPHRVGVMFFGKDPPVGSDFYLLPTGPSQVERRSPRYELFVNVRVHRSAPSPDGRVEELSVIENLSEEGAQQPTTLPIAKDEVVVVEEIGGPFRARAQVRNVHVGKDKIARLNLRFVDPEDSERARALLRKSGMLGAAREGRPRS